MSSALQACGRRVGLSIGHGFRHVSCKVNAAITPFGQFRFAFATNRSTFAFNARCGFSCDSFKAESAVSHRSLSRALFSSSFVSMEGGSICKEDDGQNFSKLEEIEEAIGSPLDSSPSVPAPKPLILVISGPSGVGKDAVIKRLQEVQKNIHFVVTATTRDKRPGEVDGKDYHFLSKEEFTSLINRDELLEYAVVYGDYKGIPKQQIRDFMSKDYDIVLRVDVQGAATLRGILGTTALFIFLVAESEVALVKRLMERKTETQKKLLLRISTAREEMKRMNEFDYVVVNVEGQLERTVNLIRSIIDAEKAKVQQKYIKI